MKHTHGEGVLVVALVAALSGCADPAARAVAPEASPDARGRPAPSSASSSSSEERAALSRIARLVAVAMDNEPARQHLKRDLKASRFREQKLKLSTYLRSKDGTVLLDRMARASGGSAADVLGTLDAVRPLEFYMPVAKHREKWTGSAEVLVVSQLNESEPIVSFDQTGREITLDRAVAPSQPTLSIVPVETNFEEPVKVSQSASLIGCETCLMDPASDLGVGGGGGVVVPPGLYLEFSRILDMKEPWFRGDPEVEVHIQGPTNSSAPTYGEDLSCSGEHAYDSRKVFDQNGGFWEGRVMLFSGDETVSFMNKYPQGFHVLFWEDDNEPCTLKLDTNSLVELLRSTAQATGTVALKVFPGATPAVLAAAFLGTFFANAGAWLLTNDDFLGVAVDQASAGYSYPGNTHVIMDGTKLNGRATIVYRQ
jgi:hypothetical protein